jgi:hypothetical protein
MLGLKVLRGQLIGTLFSLAGCIRLNRSPRLLRFSNLELLRSFTPLVVTDAHCTSLDLTVPCRVQPGEKILAHGTPWRIEIHVSTSLPLAKAYLHTDALPTGVGGSSSCYISIYALGGEIYR